MDGSGGFTSGVNPYEAPQGPAALRSLVDEGDAGPWRDRDLLVMRNEGHCDLPSRCVITGSPVGPNPTYFRVLTYAKSFSDRHNVSLPMHWPITESARPRRSVLLMTGVAVSIATMLLSIWMYRREATSLPQGLPYRGVCVAAAIIAVICLIVDNLTSKPFLSIVRTEDGFAWITGAHKDFLNELPPWPGGNG